MFIWRFLLTFSLFPVFLALKSFPYWHDGEKLSSIQSRFKVSKLKFSPFSRFHSVCKFTMKFTLKQPHLITKIPLEWEKYICTWLNIKTFIFSGIPRDKQSTRVWTNSQQHDGIFSNNILQTQFESKSICFICPRERLCDE